MLFICLKLILLSNGYAREMQGSSEGASLRWAFHLLPCTHGMKWTQS